MRASFSIGLVCLCVGMSVILTKESQARSTHDHEFNLESIKSEYFDYLILRQIWPAATCMFPGQHTVSITRPKD